MTETFNNPAANEPRSDKAELLAEMAEIDAGILEIKRKTSLAHGKFHERGHRHPDYHKWQARQAELVARKVKIQGQLAVLNTQVKKSNKLLAEAAFIEVARQMLSQAQFDAIFKVVMDRIQIGAINDRLVQVYEGSGHLYSALYGAARKMVEHSAGQNQKMAEDLAHLKQCVNAIANRPRVSSMEVERAVG